MAVRRLLLRYVATAEKFRPIYTQLVGCHVVDDIAHVDYHGRIILETHLYVVRGEESLRGLQRLTGFTVEEKLPYRCTAETDRCTTIPVEMTSLSTRKAYGPASAPTQKIPLHRQRGSRSSLFAPLPRLVLRQQHVD